MSTQPPSLPPTRSSTTPTSTSPTLLGRLRAAFRVGTPSSPSSVDSEGTELSPMVQGDAAVEVAVSGTPPRPSVEDVFGPEDETTSPFRAVTPPAAPARVSPAPRAPSTSRGLFHDEPADVIAEEADERKTVQVEEEKALRAITCLRTTALEESTRRERAAELDRIGRQAREEAGARFTGRWYSIIIAESLFDVFSEKDTDTESVLEVVSVVDQEETHKAKMMPLWQKVLIGAAIGLAVTLVAAGIIAILCAAWPATIGLAVGGAMAGSGLAIASALGFSVSATVGMAIGAALAGAAAALGTSFLGGLIGGLSACLGPKSTAKVHPAAANPSEAIQPVLPTTAPSADPAAATAATQMPRSAAEATAAPQTGAGLFHRYPQSSSVAPTVVPTAAPNAAPTAAPSVTFL